MSGANEVGQYPTGQTGHTRRPDPLVGTIFAERYKILSVLGHGGMGVVYKAHHEYMDRPVAIKMLLPQMVSDDRSVERFKHEAKAASRINHPNIIALYDFGLSPDGLPYLVMDYIEGQSLSEYIDREGQLGVNRSLDIFIQVCDALHHAHLQNIIHRDLKPGNIMLVKGVEEEIVKVVDFGVAKIIDNDGESAQRLTATGEIFGSPVYMSPEQCLGQRLTPSSDIYSLGCVLYETLTGKLPIVGANALETLSRHMHTIPASFGEVRPDLYIPEQLEQVVFRMLGKTPEQRQANMLEVQEELLAVRKGRTIGSAKPSVRGLETYATPADGIKVTSMRNYQAPTMTPAKAAPQAGSGSIKIAVIGAVVAAVLIAVLGLGAFAFFYLNQHKEPQAQTGAVVPAGGSSSQMPSIKPVTRQALQSSQTAQTSSAPPATTHKAPILTTNGKPVKSGSLTSSTGLISAPVHNGRVRHPISIIVRHIKETRAPAHTTSSGDSAGAPVYPVHRSHGDFYDYMNRQGHYNSPQPLPMKEAGGQ